MPFCSSNGITIYHEVHGSGFPLLFISGLSGGTWSWYGQVPFFKASYRTIVFDNRGAGRSSMPAGSYRMADLAADAASVLDHLGVTEAFVVGLSMGGMIAQELALREPRRVRALVLGCTHCGGEQRIPPAPQVLAAFVDNVGLAQEQIIEKNLPFFFSAGFFSASPADVDSYRQAQLEAPLQPPHALAAQLAAIRSFESCSRLAAVRPPTLIVTGTQDVLVPRENARLLAQLIPHAEYHEIPGAGHAIHVECREELNRLIHTFLQRCGGTTPTEIRRS